MAAWAKTHGYRSFGSSTLFHFGGLKVSPDEALILAPRFDALSPEEQDATVQLVPDVVVEIVPKSRGFGKTCGGALPKCRAMHDAGVGFTVMLDPYAGESADSVTTWGVSPEDFSTDWDDVFNP